MKKKFIFIGAVRSVYDLSKYCCHNESKQLIKVNGTKQNAEKANDDGDTL